MVSDLTGPPHVHVHVGMKSHTTAAKLFNQIKKKYRVLPSASSKLPSIFNFAEKRFQLLRRIYTLWYSQIIRTNKSKSMGGYSVDLIYIIDFVSFKLGIEYDR